METQRTIRKEYARPEGVEVKVNMTHLNTIIAYLILVLLIFGGLLYNWIWGGLSDYQGGYGIGKMIRLYIFSFRGISILICSYLIYCMIQYFLLYCFLGKDYRSIRWHHNWQSCGFLLLKPLALKYYRWVLLIPFLVMGVFPLIHGFCVGNLEVYVLGVFYTAASCGNCCYLWKLRSFNGEDKIVDGEKLYSAIVIKSVY